MSLFRAKLNFLIKSKMKFQPLVIFFPSNWLLKQHPVIYL